MASRNTHAARARDNARQVRATIANKKRADELVRTGRRRPIDNTDHGPNRAQRRHAADHAARIARGATAEHPRRARHDRRPYATPAERRLVQAVNAERLRNGRAVLLDGRRAVDQAVHAARQKGTAKFDNLLLAAGFKPQKRG